MAIVSVRIPQIGEGLQEARLVATLKQPGEMVKRDEPIYQMETDKAVMDVESPFSGRLTEWLANPDDVLAIGAEVARMEVESAEPETVAPTPASEPAEAATAAKAGTIPPRTRAYAKEKGLSEDVLQKLAAGKAKLMPEDIDAHLQGGKSATYDDRPVPGKQRILNTRLVRATQLVVPGTITAVVNWEGIARERAKAKSSGGTFQPSSFTLFAYAVAQAVKDHPSLKTALIGEDTYRTYKQLSLGIAVSLPGDELVLAVVENADGLSWPDFAAACKERIELARTGVDQVNEAVTLSLTNMQSFGLRDAVPVVVPPAVATLFLGEVYNTVHQVDGQWASQQTANLALTFDHRVLNGVGAAQFLAAVKKNAEQITALLS
ncbi:MAG TPA: 2-oxo acid dehydrogenase subunit E2 [Fimbriimonas sp.]|nr:2-oxo acid dehydrogenase subunit E2 [Fimbriimonas sp.]